MRHAGRRVLRVCFVEGLIGKVSRGGIALISDEDVATALLEEASVGVVHGSAFGLGPYLRFAYALDNESLRRACTAVQDFCASTTNQ